MVNTYQDQDDFSLLSHNKILEMQREDGAWDRIYAISGEDDVEASSLEGSQTIGGLNTVKRSTKMDTDCFAGIARSFIMMSVGDVELVSTVRQIQIYSGLATAVGTGMAVKGEAVFGKKKFKRDLKLGAFGRELQTAGIDPSILKNNKGKMKSRLSKGDMKQLMTEISQRFKESSLFDIDLREISSKSELKKIRERLTSKRDIALLDCYIKLFEQKEWKMKLNKARRGTRRSLVRVFRNVLRDSDLFQTYSMIQRYASLSISAIRSVRKLKKETKRIIRKDVVRRIHPLDARLKRKQMKKGARSMTRKNRKMARKRHRGVHRKVAGKANGGINIALQKTFGIVGKVFSFPGRITHFFLVAGGASLFFVFIIALLGGALLVIMSTIPSGDNEMSSGKTVIETITQDMQELNKTWIQELVDMNTGMTPKEANNGDSVFGGQDPLSGENYEIKEFDSNPVYKFYNALAFNAIAADPKDFRKETLSDTWRIVPYANTKAVAIAGSIYKTNTGISDDQYIEFCKQLWEHSHVYQTGIGKVYMCSGDKTANVSCLDLDKYKGRKDAAGNAYSDSFFPEGTTGDGCRSFFCNKQSSYDEIRYTNGTEKTYDKAKKGCKNVSYDTKFFAYCAWSGENIQDIGIDDASDQVSVQRAYVDSEGEYVDETDDDSTAGPDYEDCSFAGISVGGVRKSDVESALAEDRIALAVNNGRRLEREYNGTTYWLGYCADMSELGAGEKQDGYVLVPQDEKNMVNGCAKEAAVNENGKILWFYSCQGHSIKKRTFYYCPGDHKGCIGHDVKYCLGHCSLEVHACIAGLTAEEQDSGQLDNTILGADNYYWEEDDGSYDPGWNGYQDGDPEWGGMMYEEEWSERYGIPPRELELEFPEL